LSGQHALTDCFSNMPSTLGSMLGSTLGTLAAR
jgi:hypothetical protein